MHALQCNVLSTGIQESLYTGLGEYHASFNVLHLRMASPKVKSVDGLQPPADKET